MPPGAGKYVGVTVAACMLFFCMPGLLYLAVILFGVIIPIQAGSLLVALRVIFKDDVDFKSAYFLMAIVLVVTSLVFFMVAILSLNPLFAYAAQFIVGSLLLGYMIKSGDEAIGILKGGLVSFLTTAITYGIWAIGGSGLAAIF